MDPFTVGTFAFSQILRLVREQQARERQRASEARSNARDEAQDRRTRQVEDELRRMQEKLDDLLRASGVSEPVEAPLVLELQVQPEYVARALSADLVWATQTQAPVRLTIDGRTYDVLVKGGTMPNPDSMIDDSGLVRRGNSVSLGDWL